MKRNEIALLNGSDVSQLGQNKRSYYLHGRQKRKKLYSFCGANSHLIDKSNNTYLNLEAASKEASNENAQF